MLRAAAARAARAGTTERDGQAADGAQAENEEGPRRLRPAEDDRRAGLRPDRHRPGRAQAAAARQTGRPRSVALPLRGTQPAQAAPPRGTRPDRSGERCRREPLSTEITRPRDARGSLSLLRRLPRHPLAGISADPAGSIAAALVTDPGS